MPASNYSSSDLCKLRLELHSLADKLTIATANLEISRSRDSMGEEDWENTLSNLYLAMEKLRESLGLVARLDNSITAA